MKLAALCLLLSLPAQAGSRLEVQGHRGARALRPENTIPAFLYATGAGADALEMDMHVTRDNVVVITHDPTLNPEICLTPAGKPIREKILVRSLSLKELQQYDCGSLRNPHFPLQEPVPKTPVPTLDAVFTALEASGLPNAKKVRFNIETKSEEAHPEFTPSPAEFVSLFLEVVKRHKVMERVTLESFDYRTLRIAHRREPALKLAVLAGSRPAGPGGLLGLMKEFPGQILSPAFDWLTKDDVTALHAAHLSVLPWTPNDPAAWGRLIAMGVDGIITDNPRALLDFLGRR